MTIASSTHTTRTTDEVRDDEKDVEFLHETGHGTYPQFWSGNPGQCTYAWFVQWNFFLLGPSHLQLLTG